MKHGPLSPLGKAALDYAARGWAIGPLKPGRKEPLTKNGFRDFTTNPDTIRRWWQEHPEANIGFCPGAADMLAIDYDTGSDIQAVAERYGLPDTGLAVETPSGGIHEYFTKPSGIEVPPSASRVANKVDIRSSNGYVVLPPSRVGDREYKWIDHGAPAPAPKALIDAACAGRRTRAADPKKINVPEDDPENIKAFAAWLTEKAKPAIEGQGGNNCLTATGAAGNSFALTAETTAELAWDLFNPLCDPPWSEYDEFEHTIMSGHRSASSEQGNLTRAYREAKVQERLDATRKLFEERKKEAGAPADTPSAVEPYKVLTPAELMDRTPREYQVKHTIPKATLGIIFGSYGVGKTFLAIYLLCLWCLGRDVFGMPSRNSTRALYIVAEGVDGFRRRLAGFMRHHGLKQPPIDVLPIAPQLFNDGDVARLIETVKRGGYGMVVYDTVSRSLVGADENSQAAMSVYIDRMDRIRRETGATIIGIHHENTTGGIRGSTVLPGGIDWMWHATALGEHAIKVANPKMKDDAAWSQPKVLMKRKVVLDDWLDEDGEPSDTLALEFDPAFRPFGTPGDDLLRCLNEALTKFTRGERAATFVEIAGAASRLGMEGFSAASLRKKFAVGAALTGTDDTDQPWQLRIVERTGAGAKPTRWVIAERPARAVPFTVIDGGKAA